MPDIADLVEHADLPEHVTWLLANRRDHIAQLVASGMSPDMGLHDALRALMAADPSPRAHGVQWMFDALVGGGLLWEDLAAGPNSKTYQTLSWFAQHRRGLEPAQRNLASHESLAGLYGALEPLLAPVQTPPTTGEGGRALRRLQRQQACDESTVVYRAEDLIVAVPHSRMAAKWWGRGTRWCTAADEDNAFAGYNKAGPLVVIVLPDTDLGKLQMHVDNGGGVTLLDATDALLDCWTIDLLWNRLEPILTWAACQGNDISHIVPRHLWRGELAQHLVSTDGLNLADIGQQSRTAAVCARAVAQNPMALKYVPQSLRDHAMCLDAVSHDGNCLQHVPAELRTPGIYAAAVSSQGTSLIGVPTELWTPELLLQAVTSNAWAIRHIPEPLRSSPICRAAVQQNGDVLSYVPRQFRDQELYMSAVKSGSSALPMIPRDAWTPQLLMTCASHHGVAIQSINKAMLGPELCLAAVQQDAKAYVHVPPHMRTHAISALALEKDGDLLPLVPDLVLDEGLCMIAVLNSPLVVDSVPSNLASRAVYMAAVGQKGRALRMVPEQHRDADMCTAAIHQDPWAIGYVPEDTLTRQMCRDAVARTPGTLMYVPYEWQDMDMCVDAMQKGPHVRQYIKPGLQAPVALALQEIERQGELAGAPRPDWHATMSLDGLAQAIHAHQARYDLVQDATVTALDTPQAARV